MRRYKLSKNTQLQEWLSLDNYYRHAASVLPYFPQIAKYIYIQRMRFNQINHCYCFTKDILK